ncbi:hypothetical protein UlMin_010917 [Ulmus minor]
MTRSQKKQVFLPLLALALSLCLGFGEAATGLPRPVKLVWHYYKVTNTCHDAEVYVRHQVNLSWHNDKSVTAKLLRLVSTDCLVTGCDASILLDGENSEKNAAQNRGLGGFVLIDNIKTVLEDRCPGVVSCADILHLATRDAVHLAGGPSYPVFTGRRDGTTSSASSVDIPSPSISLDQALSYFKSKGLDEEDMTILLGAHTMGKTFCRFIEDRLYNFNGTKKADPSMDKKLVAEMRGKCPPRLRQGQGDPTVYLNPENGNSYKFTNSYYSNLLENKAVLGIDQQLKFGPTTADISNQTAYNFELFRKAFALSISRLGSFNVLTGKEGQIRHNCRHINNK